MPKDSTANAAKRNWSANTRTALYVIGTWGEVMQTGCRLGRGGSHNGSDQRQSDGCSYAYPSNGDATGRTFNLHFCCDKEMSVRQLVQGQQYHRFVHMCGELPRKRSCDLRRAMVTVA